MELYSKGLRTFLSDKFVALAGVASVMAAHEGDGSGDGYVAGLWQASLPARLL